MYEEWPPELAELVAPELRELPDDWLDDDDLTDEPGGFSLMAGLSALTERCAPFAAATRGSESGTTRTGSNAMVRAFPFVAERICIPTMTVASRPVCLRRINRSWFMRTAIGGTGSATRHTCASDAPVAATGMGHPSKGIESGSPVAALPLTRPTRSFGETGTRDRPCTTRYARS